MTKINEVNFFEMLHNYLKMDKKIKFLQLLAIK